MRSRCAALVVAVAAAAAMVVSVTARRVASVDVVANLQVSTRELAAEQPRGTVSVPIALLYNAFQRTGNCSS